MLRSVCHLTLLLLFCDIGHANALLTTPIQSFTFPSDQSSLEGSSVQTAVATDSTVYIAATSETTYQPVSESSTTEDATEQGSATTEANEQTTLAYLATSPMTPIPTSTTTVTSTATTVKPTHATTPNSTSETTSIPTNATTPLPTTATTAEPSNTTSVHNVTTASTPAPTTVPPVPSPTVGEYTIRADPNSSVCLMARMGLQFSFGSLEGRFQTVNLDPMPNVTTISGTCGRNGSDSTLVLQSDKITVQFVFARQMSKFHLSALNFTVDTGSGYPFTAASTNLSLWEASLGSSYMCQKEQSYNITDHLILSTFQLQVQPFNITNNKFSTAHECSVDDTSLLIPIIVGAALAGLILIVVIAYVIGRRKTYVGYQTL